ncbi:MAG TPA: hypothetical protein VN324_14720 [Quisquiliibacterium sp.]|nr:hypothetical protein [Quisquiliibacterium sp.]
MMAYGVFGEVTARSRAIGIDCMHSVHDRLRAQGANADLLTLDPLASVETNAARFGDVLSAASRAALLIGCSEGRVEALAGPIDPEARRDCLGFVALQSPCPGRPIADIVMQNRTLAGTSGAVARGPGIGSGVGLRDLAQRVRRRRMTAHAAQLAQTLATVPTVCVATCVTPRVSRGRGRFHVRSARWMERRGLGPDDGRGPAASALLPGMRHQQQGRRGPPA